MTRHERVRSMAQRRERVRRKAVGHNRHAFYELEIFDEYPIESWMLAYPATSTEKTN